MGLVWGVVGLLVHWLEDTQDCLLFGFSNSHRGKGHNRISSLPYVVSSPNLVPSSNLVPLYSMHASTYIV